MSHHLKQNLEPYQGITTAQEMKFYINPIQNEEGGGFPYQFFSPKNFLTFILSSFATLV